jgi:predicted permease
LDYAAPQTNLNGLVLNFIFGTLLGLVVGILIGTLYTRQARRYWRWRLGRKLQLIVVRSEMKGYRHKRKRPMLSRWQKCLLGWLHNITPTFTRYTNFDKATSIL